MPDPLFSLIIPSRGTRPKALKSALEQIRQAAEQAFGILAPEQAEILVGFDGVRGERVMEHACVHYFDLPRDTNWGNGIRNILLKRAKGQKIVFHDDDNALTKNAFETWLRYFSCEMLIARIDVSRAFDCKYLPQDLPGKSLVRQGNIDPLCLCLSRELVVDRCGGWSGKIGYEADYLNILNYHRRAFLVEVTQEIVGIYDAGQGLDPQGINFRQERLLCKGEKSKVIG
ncbi:MAG: glycosyltransferase family 2 protein [Desulfonatronovibrionaceae bacterium]